MRSPDRVRHFVQNTLGCGCPEEVFRAIEVRRAVRLNSFIVLDSAVIIGDRLLIYCADAGSAGCIEEHLPVLIEAGKRERDTKGLNRFRLVLAADRPDDLRQAAGKLFDELRGPDEKVHLHVIGRDGLPFTAEEDEDDAEVKEWRGGEER